LRHPTISARRKRDERDFPEQEEIRRAMLAP
jgi:hypothetical protein